MRNKSKIGICRRSSWSHRGNFASSSLLHTSLHSACIHEPSGPCYISDSLRFTEMCQKLGWLFSHRQSAARHVWGHASFNATNEICYWSLDHECYCSTLVQNLVTVSGLSERITRGDLVTVFLVSSSASLHAPRLLLLRLTRGCLEEILESHIY